MNIPIDAASLILPPILTSRQRTIQHYYYYKKNSSNNNNFIFTLLSVVQRRFIWLMFLLLLLTLGTTRTDAIGIDTGNATYDDVPEPIDYAPPRFAVLFPWFIQVIGVFTFFIITRYELIIPFQACMFLIGAASGIVSTIRYNAVDTTSYSIVDELDQLSISVLQWSSIDSAVLLLVFLPGLIFRDAIEGNVSVLFLTDISIYLFMYLSNASCFFFSLRNSQF
jgi:hypothetical protein